MSECNLLVLVSKSSLDFVAEAVRKYMLMVLALDIVKENIHVMLRSFAESDSQSKPFDYIGEEFDRVIGLANPFISLFIPQVDSDINSELSGWGSSVRQWVDEVWQFFEVFVLFGHLLDEHVNHGILVVIVL